MKIAFTICSNNYLSQAKTLGDSIKETNKDYTFFIGLCDRKDSNIDYNYFLPYEIIEADKLNIDEFDKMQLNYDIVELNTSVKPFYFKYFFDNYIDIELAIYFDPDIYVYNNLLPIETELGKANALLTPHIITTIPNDRLMPIENNFLNYGLYNLGFLALRRSETTKLIIDWWADKLKDSCYQRVSEGLFVDQLPLNYLPIFFENIIISKNLGLNMAYWNLHEREITSYNEESKFYFINNKYPLIFFHFSNFNPLESNIISKYQNRFHIDSNPLFRPLFFNYATLVLKNKYIDLKKSECYYVKQRKAHFDELLQIKTNSESSLKKIIRAIRIALENSLNISIQKR
ncbi:glycosyltransferase family protein [Spirosoma aerolatum]|uniref:hypothetical protein n=1 Tax=Spirosoma aerolatum TaxID=1211326 RepID=UPI0009ADED6D|nr:hypothetical protein [Spirosoma aerolatum]